MGLKPHSRGVYWPLHHGDGPIILFIDWLLFNIKRDIFTTTTNIQTKLVLMVNRWHRDWSVGKIRIFTGKKRGNYMLWLEHYALSEWSLFSSLSAILLLLSHLVFTISSYFCVLSGEAKNATFVCHWFYLIRAWEHANHYIIDAVHDLLDRTNCGSLRAPASCFLRIQSVTFSIRETHICVLPEDIVTCM